MSETAVAPKTSLAAVRDDQAGAEGLSVPSEGTAPLENPSAASIRASDVAPEPATASAGSSGLGPVLTEKAATDSKLGDAVRSKLTDVESTALGVAWFRSRAADRFRRPDGLPYYDGSYDTALLDRHKADSVREQQKQQALASHFDLMLEFMLIRTAEIDEQVMSALRGRTGAETVTSHAVRQVVLLGAGLDARAWRLPPLLHPSGLSAGSEVAGEVTGVSGGGEGSGAALTFIELDSGSVEQLKVEVLGQPRGCRRVFCPVDLSIPGKALEALSAAGHDPSRPTVFVAEGLIGYLTKPAGDGLLAAIRSVAAPGSGLVMDGPVSPKWRDELTAEGIQLYLQTYEESQETVQRVQKAGWQARLISADELGQKYGMSDNRFELIVGTC